jgi:hypothetical protein
MALVFGVVKNKSKGFEYYHYAAMLGNVFAIANILDIGHRCFNVFGNNSKDSKYDCAVRAQLCNTFIHLVIKHKYCSLLSQKAYNVWRDRVNTTVRAETTVKLLEYWRCHDLRMFRNALTNVWQNMKICNMREIYVYLLSASSNDKITADAAQFIILGYNGLPEGNNT